MSQELDAFLKPLEDAYRHIQMPVMVISSESSLVMVANPITAKSTGYRNTEIKGMHFSRFFKPEDQDRVQAMLEAGNELGSYTEFNLRVVRQSGRIIHVDLNGHRVPTGHGDVIIFCLHDITSLKKANEELEEKVRLRTADLETSKIRIQAILNSSLQGFVTFSRDLTIESDFSLKAVQILGDDIFGKRAADVLCLSLDLVKNLSIMVFDQQKTELLAQVGSLESEIHGRNVSIQFTPIFEGPLVKRILATVTDITPVKLLRQKAEKLEKESRCLVMILKSKTIFMNIIEAIQEVDIDPLDLLSVRRYVHTLKGEFAFFECEDIAELCEMWEYKWTKSYSPAEFQTFVQQLRFVLDDFIKRYNNVLHLNRVVMDAVSLSIENVKRLAVMVRDQAQPTRVIEFLDEIVQRPVEEVLTWLGDAWLIAARAVGKKVEPVQWQSNVLIYVTPYRKLFNSLIHAVRNAADHAIETPEERVSIGKPEKGKLIVKLELVDSVYHLRLQDDGRGVDLDKVLAKARSIQMAIPDDLAKNPEKIMELLFAPGFSTKNSPTQLSGMGIGLNAIKEEARVLGGDAKMINLREGGAELQVWFRKVPILES